MARFDVHRCRRPGVPYLLDNQADFLSALPTRLVIPLSPATAIGSPIDRLHLRVTVAGAELILATNLMASVRRDQLGQKVASLADRRSDIVAAVDFLQQGSDPNLPALAPLGLLLAAAPPPPSAP